LLAREAQPAVSLYLPTHVAGREIRQDGIRLKKLLAQTADRLHAEWRRSETDAFLAPAASLVEDEKFWRHQEKRLAVFLAPDFSRVHKLPLAVAEEAVLGPHFHIKPLLPILDDAGPFRLLAISAKHTQLYQGSRWNFAEVEGIDLPQGVGAIAARIGGTGLAATCRSSLAAIRPDLGGADTAGDGVAQQRHKWLRFPGAAKGAWRGV
jgi:hypothetical protein